MRGVMKPIIAICMFALAASVVAAQDFLSIVEDGSPSEVQAAIDDGANVNVRGDNGETPLMWAAFGNGKSEVLELLINAGADVSVRAEGGVTPLMAAAGNNNPEVIERLIDAGGGCECSRR